MRLVIVGSRVNIYVNKYDPDRKRTVPKYLGSFPARSLPSHQAILGMGISESDIPALLGAYRKAISRSERDLHQEVLRKAPDALADIARAVASIGTRSDTDLLGPALAAVRDAIVRARRRMPMEDLPVVLVSDRPDTETLYEDS